MVNSVTHVPSVLKLLIVGGYQKVFKGALVTIVDVVLYYAKFIWGILVVFLPACSLAVLRRSK